MDRVSRSPWRGSCGKGSPFPPDALDREPGSEVLTEKGFRAQEDILLHPAITKAMAFLRVAMHLHHDSPLAEGGGHALRLLRQDHPILQPLEQHHRALTIPDPVQWRTLPIPLGCSRPWPHQALQVAALKTVGLLGQGRQIRDPIATGPHPKQAAAAEAPQGR